MADKNLGKVLPAHAVDPNSFPFSNIKIYTEQQLGTGSYGIVCKARCDKLLCAAKLLHNIFFLSSDPGVAVVKDKFEEECRLMASIVHPCIVQFIGVAVSLDNQPVLLTELMDTSLMKFIDHTNQTPHRTLHVDQEMNIVNDIAMGLSYLHSRNIIHRDLSSNNVLLNKGYKAKITDFGVSKIYNTTASSTMGSTGLRYQTRCPGTPFFMPPEASRNGTLYSDKLDVFSFGVICIHLLSKCPPSPGPAQVEKVDSNGDTVYYPVSEKNRRANDIKLIPTKHCLRHLSISMISDSPKARPSADEICDKLMEIKCSDLYKSSTTQTTTESALSNTEKQLNKELEQIQSENLRLCKELDNVKIELSTESNEVCKLRKENVKLKKVVEELRNQNSVITERLESIESSSSSVEDSISLNPTITTGSEWSKLETSLPGCFKRGSIARVGHKVYISRPFSTIVHELDLENKVWNTLPSYANEEFSLAEFDGHLVAVGGIKSKSVNKTCSKVVSKYNPLNDSWESNVYPHLFYGRALPACTNTETFLIVAGGSEELPPKRPLHTVEIYNKESSQWYCTYSLPQSLSYPVAVTMGDDLYVIGGASSDHLVWLMYHCSIKYLFKWSNRHMVPRATVQQVWDSVQLPVAMPTAVVLNCNNLVLFGGTMSNEGDTPNHSNQVLKYNKQQGNFAISLMPRKRGKCLAVTLPSHNSVLIMGGCGSKTVDIGHFK